jgi:hypothetical protein
MRYSFDANRPHLEPPMVDVFLDPRLPDHVREHDWRTLDARAVMGDYSSESLIVLQHCPTEAIDFEFLQTVSLPQTWEMKKLVISNLLARIDRGETSHPLVKQVFEDGFKGNTARYQKFIGQLRVLSDISHRMLDRLLDGLVVSERQIVCRFSDTRMENLHYDLDANADDHEAFRLYINLDDQPRIWSISYPVSELIAKGGQRITNGIPSDLKSEIRLERVTGRAFGGWNQRATERVAPRHMVFFDPGDVWIVDGRAVSHQVLQGRRVLSVYARLPVAGNEGRIRSSRQRLDNAFAQAQLVPVGAETAQVNYFTPGQITGSQDLKGEWADLFGRPGDGAVRRFNDRGLAEKT